MEIFLGADHGGFRQKEIIKGYLKDLGYDVEDLGNLKEEPRDDYPDFAKKVAEKVSRNPAESKGILFCRSGAGMDMVANKFPNVRSALVFNEKLAIQSREHEDANVLSIPSDWLDDEAVKKIVKVWLETPFSGEERHARRLQKIHAIEEELFHDH
ncbi:RpiB/LacA/LacB family sugar-phosphate isomerase [Candidatus Azambacteria bacterium]|nr:RpiB/LacA/LacB family sugar-phosphate isomerase [Candidatus Azambacteria bacterium]